MKSNEVLNKKNIERTESNYLPEDKSGKQMHKIEEKKTGYGLDENQQMTDKQKAKEDDPWWLYRID